MTGPWERAESMHCICYLKLFNLLNDCIIGFFFAKFYSIISNRKTINFIVLNKKETVLLYSLEDDLVFKYNVQIFVYIIHFVRIPVLKINRHVVKM